MNESEREGDSVTLPAHITPEDIAAVLQLVGGIETDTRAKEGQKRLLKIGGLVTACTAIATAASVALASFGFKVMGPPAEIAAVRNDVTAVKGTVTDLKIQVDSIIVTRERNKYETDAKLTALDVKSDQALDLLCILLRRQDPTLVPKKCN